MWRALVLICLTGLLQCKSEEVKTASLEERSEALEAETRIVGGYPTTIQKYPFAVQIYANNAFGCGGTLISRRHVLSAAHCFLTTSLAVDSPSRYTVRVGTELLNSGGTLHYVSAILVHQNYRPLVSQDADIAVLLLTRAVTLGSRVALASLPSQSATVPSLALVTHIGWGTTYEGGTQASPVLREVSVPVVNQTVCAARYRNLTLQTGLNYLVTDNMICAGLLDVGGMDACQGDSGGPLLWSGLVVGVTSWGEGCARPQYPGVSTRVASYSSWIGNVMATYSSGPRSSSGSLLLVLAAASSWLLLRT